MNGSSQNDGHLFMLLGKTLHYLQKPHRKPRSLENTYDRLSRGLLCEWFTPHGELTEKYVYAISRSTAQTGYLTYLGALADYLDVVKSVVHHLKNMRSVGQTISGRNTTNI